MISAAIVTHPDRFEHARAIQAALPPWRPKMFVDRMGFGCTDNHLQAWEELGYRGDAEWSLVLEDDAILHPDILTQLPLALAHAPAPIVSLYLGQGRPPHWQTKAARAVSTRRPYILCTTLLHCVAVAVRTPNVLPMLGYVAKEAHSEMQTVIDEAITSWCKHTSTPVAYLNPSLVNHDHTVPSVAIHQYGTPDPSPRVAHHFGRRTSWCGQAAIM